MFPVYLFSQLSIVEEECVELWKFRSECFYLVESYPSLSIQCDSLWTVRVAVGHTIEDIALIVGDIASSEELWCEIS